MWGYRWEPGDDGGLFTGHCVLRTATVSQWLRSLHMFAVAFVFSRSSISQFRYFSLRSCICLATPTGESGPRVTEQNGYRAEVSWIK